VGGVRTRDRPARRLPTATLALVRRKASRRKGEGTDVQAIQSPGRSLRPGSGGGGLVGLAHGALGAAHCKDVSGTLTSTANFGNFTTRGTISGSLKGSTFFTGDAHSPRPGHPPPAPRPSARPMPTPGIWPSRPRRASSRPAAWGVFELVPNGFGSEFRPGPGRALDPASSRERTGHLSFNFRSDATGSAFTQHLHGPDLLLTVRVLGGESPSCGIKRDPYNWKPFRQKVLAKEPPQADPGPRRRGHSLEDGHGGYQRESEKDQLAVAPETLTPIASTWSSDVWLLAVSNGFDGQANRGSGGEERCFTASS